MDSHSVDAAIGGEHRRRDNAKSGDARKRLVVADSMGLMFAVLVTAASVDDARAAPQLFARLSGQPVGKVRRVFADEEYHNYDLYEWVEANPAWELEIVKRPEGQKGWGEAAAAVDGGAYLRVVGPMPSADQGPGEECVVVGGVLEVGDGPTDAQPTRAQQRGC